MRGGRWVAGAVLLAAGLGVGAILLQRRPPAPDGGHEGGAVASQTPAEDPALAAALADLPAVWEPARTPDIVVIVLDTARRDRFGVYGNPDATTPRIDAWARGARVYDEARADGSWTLPSHASLFTGVWPVSHGADGTPPGQAALAWPLPEGTPTVAQALRNAGYRTVGIAANRAFLDPTWGLTTGFDLWWCRQLAPGPDGGAAPSADRVSRLARQVLTAPRSGGVFLFLNYMDAHTPWRVRPAYLRSPDRVREDSLPGTPGWTATTHDLLVHGSARPEDLASWSEVYDSEIRYLDDEVGALLDDLPSLGVGPEDYVFVLSDHGEYLGEHGLVEHAKDAYEEVSRVPLLIRGPGYAPGHDATPVQHHDVARLLLAAARLPPLPGAVDTATLGVQVTENYYARQRDLHDAPLLARFGRVRRAFVQGGHALVVGDDGSSEAYDLATDPAERAPLTSPGWGPDLAERARGWLGAQVPARTGGEAVVVPANVEALRALGYLE